MYAPAPTSVKHCTTAAAAVNYASLRPTACNAQPHPASSTAHYHNSSSSITLCRFAAYSMQCPAPTSFKQCKMQASSSTQVAAHMKLGGESADAPLVSKRWAAACLQRHTWLKRYMR
jgi:hypothetical protein